jgi:type VI secretion system protein VasJ
VIDYLNALYDRVIKPISDESPCGENAKYDERFDRVKSEVMKLTAGSVGMDWNAILINSDELLSEKTKDLTLAAYLVLGLVKINGYPGLAVGLKCLIYFLENYWENMFPPIKRQRARIQTFEWINERIPIILSTVEVKPEHSDSVRNCNTLIEEFTQKAQNAIPTQPISFASLRAEITAAVEVLPEPPAAQPVAEEPSTSATSEDITSSGTENSTESAESSTVLPPATSLEPATEATTQTVQPMAPVPTTTEIGSIKEGLNAIVKVVQLIREAQPDAPVAYRLGRVVKWETVESLPPADGEGKTRIPAPREQELQIFEMQLSAQKWNALKESAEDAFLNAAPWRFNLNLQRYVFLALQGCGASNAADVVQMETGRFLLRFPELVDMSYSTGVPFADGATRAWCEESVLLASAGDGNAGDDTEDMSWQDDAKSLAQSKGLAAAIELIQGAIKKAPSKRDASKRQLFAAKLCITHSHFHWAIPMLESLHQQIMNSKLMQWEPDFCSEVWNNLLKSYNTRQDKIETEKEELDRRSQIRQLLYSVDLVRAVSVTPKNN